MTGITLFGDLTGAAAAADALNQGFSADAIWGAVTPFLQVIITVTLASFGIYMIRRISKKVSKGKGGA